jgi:hypothetical protein
MAETSGRMPDDSTRKPRRRWLRILIVLLLIPIILFGLGLVLIRQSWVVVPLVRPILAKELGGEVEIGAAKVEGSDSIILRDVIVRSPAHEGEAAVIARIASISVGTNIIGLLFGENEPLTIELDGAQVRVSEDVNRPGEFSFMGLEREDDDEDDEDSQGQALTLLLRDGMVEVGTHDGPQFTRSGTLPIEGTIESTGPQEEWFKFELWETAEGGTGTLPDPLRIKGRVNIDTQAMEGRIDGLIFDERLRELCPNLVQAWWTALDPEGAVRDARLEMDGRGGVAASITVRDVALTIPIEREDVWRRYALGTDDAPAGLPRMRVQSGRVELRDGVLTLDHLEGVLLSSERTRNLAEVPYKVNGTFGSRDAVLDWSEREKWLDHLLHFAPINISFVMEDFQYDGTPGSRNAAVELPAAITRVLEQFSVESCTLDTNITISRAEATRDPAGALVEQEIVTAGRAKLVEGRGAYVKFAYPLEDVTAEMRFDNREVVVESLLARGPNGGSISIGGRVFPPAKWPNVDLHISGAGLPVDDNLRRALPEKYRGVLDALRHQPSFDELTAAGALPPDAFALGGTINIEIDVDREEGQGNKTQTTGLIEIFDGGLVLDHFPYPFTLEKGLLQLERGRVLVRDWIGRALGGGSVFVRGEVATPVVDGKTRVQPDLEIGVFDDRINPAIIRAVGMAGRDRDVDVAMLSETEQALARASEMLERATVEGVLSWEGAVTTADDGDVDWNFAVALDDGAASPSDADAGRLRELGLFWPAGLSLNPLAGSFTVSNEAVHVARLVGRRGEGELGIEGEIAIRDGDPAMTFDLDFTNFAIEPYLLSFVSDAARDRAAEIWSRWQPEGRFDALLAYRSGVEGAHDGPPVTVRLSPRELSIVVDESRLAVAPDHDEESPAILAFDDGGFSFSGLRVLLGGPETHDGALELSGEIADDEARADALRGRIVGGRFESPWLKEFYALGEAHEWAEWSGQFQPRGLFDADFELSRSTGNRARFTAGIHPHSLGILYRNTAVSAAFGPEGAITVEPGRVALAGLTGRLGTGAAFSLSGEVDTADLIDARLVVAYEGDVYDAEASTFVPDALLEGLREMKFEAGSPVRINDAQVRLRQMRAEGEGDRVWRRSFRGPVVLDEAAFEAGVSFHRARGRLHVTAEAEEGKPTRAQVDIALERMLARGRHLTNINGTLLLSQNGEEALLPVLSASCYQGMATASAVIGLTEGAPYEARVDLAAVNLRGFSRAREEADDPPPGPETTTDGTIFASISLEGYRGAPEHRRGRGTVRVVDGTLASNPVTLPLMQISQLMLPLDASLSYGEATFYILGDRAFVEEFLLESDRLLLSGEGTVGLDDLALDLRLRSRGRVVGLSDVVGAVSDQLYGIVVTGPLADPDASIVPLPALSGLFRSESRPDLPPAMREGPDILPPERAGDASAGVSGNVSDQ